MEAGTERERGEGEWSIEEVREGKKMCGGEK